MKRGKKGTVGAGLLIAITSGCFYNEYSTWEETPLRERRYREVRRRAVESAPTFAIDERNARVDGNHTIELPCTRTVEVRAIRIMEEFEVVTLREIHHREPTWVGRNSWFFAIGLMGAGLAVYANTDQYDVEGRLLALGLVLGGVPFSKAAQGMDYSSTERRTGLMREQETLLGTTEEPAPHSVRRRETPASGVRFRLAVGPPFAFPGESGGERSVVAEADRAGIIRIVLKMPEGRHLTQAAARADLGGIPEGGQISDRMRLRDVLGKTLGSITTTRNEATIAIYPLDRERGTTHATLSFRFPFWSVEDRQAQRLGVHRAVAELCGQLINNRCTRMGISVRDADTYQPVAATVELDIRAPTAEEILMPYVSGDLLRRAVKRARNYSRGKTQLQVTGQAAFIWVHRNSTIAACEASAPDYRSKSIDNPGGMEEGVLIITLQRQAGSAQTRRAAEQQPGEEGSDSQTDAPTSAGQREGSRSE